jgi:DNA-binding IclR family transcriptional regulator
MAMARPTVQDSPSSVRRALSLLDAFDADTPELSIRELANRAGIPRSTVHRLTTVLLEWGALERGEHGLRLGMKLFELGSLARSPGTLREAASPYLHTLSEVTRLTANLAIREGNAIVYLEKIGSAGLRVPHSRFGGRGSLHATALGKAILAFSSPDEITAALKEPLPRVTDKTITDPVLLRRELDQIRRTGVAFDLEESQAALFCVAAPVRDPRGVVLAGVSITGATAASQADQFGPTVIATARGIERRIASLRGTAALSSSLPSYEGRKPAIPPAPSAS